MLSYILYIAGYNINHNHTSGLSIWESNVMLTLCRFILAVWTVKANNLERIERCHGQAYVLCI